MKLIRNTVIATVVLLATGWVAFGSSFRSVVDTAVHQTRETMRGELGPDFRLAQAERELSRVADDIDAQRRRVAELRVSCEDLDEQVGEVTARLDRAKMAFVAADDAWARSGAGARPAALGGRLVEPERIRDATERLAAKIKGDTTWLELRRQVLSTRREALAAAESHLGEIERRRERVMLALETSRAELETCRVLQQSIGADVDDSALASAESMVRDLSRDLRVERETLTLASRQDDPVESLLEWDEQSSVDEVRAMLDRDPTLARSY